VTNGQVPDVLEKMEEPTQLYISVSAPDEKMFEEINRPISGSWKNLMKSLDIMKNLSSRTTIRLTMIKGKNMISPEKYAALLERASPKFVEVKAYMWVGASQDRLQLENMPYHEDVQEFAKKICEKCSYKIVDEHERSRVLLLMKEDFDGRVMLF